MQALPPPFESISRMFIYHNVFDVPSETKNVHYRLCRGWTWAYQQRKQPSINLPSSKHKHMCTVNVPSHDVRRATYKCVVVSHPSTYCRRWHQPSWDSNKGGSKWVRLAITFLRAQNHKYQSLFFIVARVRPWLNHLGVESVVQCYCSPSLWTTEGLRFGHMATSFWF